MTTSSADSSLVQEGDLVAGKYRVERVLGVGGMGVVVAATHIELEQRVALKLLLPETMQNAEAVERFLREARASVRLHSEHVAKVLDVGKLPTGAPYIVMEYLDGKDLGQVVENGALPVGTAVDYLLQACEAIAEAHSLGIVHRDLKPQNLFLTKRIHGAPLVKVLDFGISKAVTGSRQDMALTKTGVVMGSPLYMSPEQMKSGRLVDHRSDIWSLGVILYQLVTGVLPFDAETVPHLCALIMTEPARTLRDVSAGLPDGLQSIVDRCLDKDMSRRFQNVAELAAALEPFAPVSARGATGRISAVLNVVPAGPAQPSAPMAATVAVTTAPTLAVLTGGPQPAQTPAQAQTATAFQSATLDDDAPARKNKKVLLLGGLGALGAAAVVTIAILATRSSPPVAPTPAAGHEAVAAESAPPSATSVPAAPLPIPAFTAPLPTSMEASVQPAPTLQAGKPPPAGKPPKTGKPPTTPTGAASVAVAPPAPPKPSTTGAPQPAVPTDMFGDRK